MALLFAQQVGLAHAATHGEKHGTTHQHGKGIKVLACDECLAFSNVQPHGYCVVGVAPPTAAAGFVTATAWSGFVPYPTPAFSSRGPPIRS